MASGAYTSMRRLPTWLHSTPTMAGTISCACHSVWRCLKMSFRCAWTRQQTDSLALLPFMMIYAYRAIPWRSMTDTCFSLWRWPNNMALSSTVWSARSGNPRSPSVVQSLPQRHVTRSLQNPNPSRLSYPWLPNVMWQDHVFVRTACQMGLEALNGCSLPAPQGLDLSDPPQYNRHILWLFLASHSANRC